MSSPKIAFHTQRQKKVHHFFFMINKLREKRKKDQCHFQLFHESLSLCVCAYLQGTPSSGWERLRKAEETISMVTKKCFLKTRLLLQLMPHHEERHGEGGSDVKRESEHAFDGIFRAERQKRTRNTLGIDVHASSGDDGRGGVTRQSQRFGSQSRHDDLLIIIWICFSVTMRERKKYGEKRIRFNVTQNPSSTRSLSRRYSWQQWIVTH